AGLAVLIGVGALVQRLRRPRVAPPAPVMVPGAPVPAPFAPQPVAAAGPGLIVLNGPPPGAPGPPRPGLAVRKAAGSHLGPSHDGFASSNHASIVFQAGVWMVYDRGSTNGTFANGVRISESRLDHGMAIRFGSTEVRFWMQ